VSDLQDVVRPNPKHLGIERTMMDCAHRDSIGNHRLAPFRIFLDVRSVKELSVAKSTGSTLMFIRTQDSLAEAGLVKALANDPFRVLSA
jgi:hypothetical protein